MYPNLKLQLWKSGIRQNRLAKLLGLHESLLSKMINGFREPSPEVRRQIAALLNCDEMWLFDNTMAAGSRISDLSQPGPDRAILVPTPTIQR